jgi:hypothetical protein
MRLKDYSEITADYKDSLILSNGASMAVSDAFSYKSLLEKGIEHKFVSDMMRNIFTFFDTTDFEFVLRHLWFARKINKYLSIDEKKTLENYKEIKLALINTVIKIHPKPFVVDPKTDRISSFVQDFKKVFYLSYDLLLYWALIKANEQNRGNRIKDCFYRGCFSEDWTYYEKPRLPVRKSTLVFILMGIYVY